MYRCIECTKMFLFLLFFRFMVYFVNSNNTVTLVEIKSIDR